MSADTVVDSEAAWPTAENILVYLRDSEFAVSEYLSYWSSTEDAITATGRTNTRGAGVVLDCEAAAFTAYLARGNAIQVHASATVADDSTDAPLGDTSPNRAVSH